MQAQIDQHIADGRLTCSVAKVPGTSSTPTPIIHSPNVNDYDSTHQSENNRSLLVSSVTSRPGPPEFQGPTSSSFLFQMATDSLAIAGIHPPTHAGLEVDSQSAATKFGRQDTISANFGVENPLRIISRNEALRLLDYYHDEYGVIYPFIDKTVLDHAAHHFYNCSDMASPSSTRTYPKDENTLSDGIWDILKLAIAISAAIENHGPNSLSARLLESVESGFPTRFLGKKVELLEIQAWTAIVCLLLFHPCLHSLSNLSKSILQFHLDDSVLAWRTIGLAGRAAIDLGLHRRETYSMRFSDNEQRLRASQLFWSIYALDRRWSFSTGRSFAIPECDIDLDLPKPVITMPSLSVQ